MEENKLEYDVYTLTDEEGNESEFVLIGKVLVSVDDDDEYDDVADYFDDLFAEEIDCDADVK